MIVALAVIMGMMVLFRVAWGAETDPRQQEWRPPPRPIATPQARGNIMDRDGALLAGSVYQWKVSIPAGRTMEEEEALSLAGILAPYFPDYTSEEWAELLTHNSGFRLLGVLDYPAGLELYQIKSYQETEDAEKRKARELLREVALDPFPVRYYPEGSMASHLLGFVNAEGKAYYGVEDFYDAYLSGEDFLQFGPEAKRVDELGSRFAQNISPENVSDLILTIDRAAQYIVERELKMAVQNAHARGGTIMVMNPRTGEVLASASLPDFEPARYWKSSDEAWVDPAVSKQYEPGSIFKVVTMAAGLNAGVISPGSTYVDTGCIDVAGKPICNLDKMPRGVMDMRDVLIYSLNLGTTYVSTQLGPEHFYAYVRLFGFGEKTDVDLAGEVAGAVHWYQTADWSPVDLATNSFGQGVAVTPLQMLRAISAVANDGRLMRPYVARGIVWDSRVMEVEPSVVEQVIDPQTARLLTDMLVDVVDTGAPAAQVPGYRVAGKSGTAQIPEGERYNGVIAGFVGYLPASDPQLAILVKIDEPQGETLGGQVAAPVFTRVAKQLVSVFGIPPDR